MTPLRSRAIGAELRRLAPRAVITCARGSSDHAATYAKYLIETRARVLTASAAPSVSSVYGVTQDLRGCLFIAHLAVGTQSRLARLGRVGESVGRHDSRACATAPDAPLIAAADLVIELRAGVETSVAATKSYLATLAALIRLVAAWTAGCGARVRARYVAGADGSKLGARLVGGAAAARVGRDISTWWAAGLGLGAAQEIALKCKETCGLHAEAFSSAELRHGPYALLGKGFPALLLAQHDATRAGVEALGARTRAPRRAGAARRRATRPARSCCRPIEAIAETRADPAGAKCLPHDRHRWRVRRGFDPDHPPHLRKITETV